MNIRKFKWLLILLPIMNISCAEESMLANKPYFTIRIESENARIQAKFNGFLLLQELKKSKIATDLPVNHLFKNGENSVKLVVLPTDRSGGFGTSKASLSLYVNDKGSDETNRKIIGQVSFSSSELNSGGSGISLSMPEMKLDSKNEFKKDEKGDVIVDTPVISEAKIFPGAKEIVQAITLNTNFPQWRYLAAEPLDFPDSYKDYEKNMALYDKALVKPLYDYHLEILELFKKKDIEKIVKLFSERNQEIDAALYLDSGTYEKMLREELYADFSSKRASIYKFDSAPPTVTDDKKLIKLGGNGMIYLTDEEKTVYSHYGMWFYKKDGKWHISR